MATSRPVEVIDTAFPTYQGPVVLAGDDDPVVLQTLGAVLRHWGVLAHLAGGGHEAVELFRRHRRAITLVLLDVRMPELDGPGALDALRRIDPEVPCWFVTGDPAPYTIPDLLSRGAAGVLGKPYDLPALRAVVDGTGRDRAREPERGAGLLPHPARAAALRAGRGDADDLLAGEGKPPWIES